MTTTDTASDAPRFAFGKNWENFVDKHFTEERVRIAQDHLLRFLSLPDLTGKRMLDIGCGSGLHSLAALRANVAELVSFDYDANSVTTTRKLHDLSGRPANWQIAQGSVLDKAYMESLGTFDVVYSWGVLHHTGDQWTALRYAADRVAPDGVFYVALYTSDVFVDPPAEFWLDVKRRYNRGGWFGKRSIEAWYVGRQFLGMLRNQQNPFAYVWGYKRSRGMSYYTDVKDWVGGWPMEFSSVQEVKDFARDQLNLELINITTGEANTEYLFQASGIGDYATFDRTLVAGEAELGTEVCAHYVERLRQHPIMTHIEALTPLSLLSVQTLALIRACTLAARGVVLEIGTYIGGVTILVSRALEERRSGRLICIEVGGEHPTHPTMPSLDILADWKKNVSAAGLENVPQLIQGYSWSPAVIRSVANALKGEKVGLVVIDADGFPALSLIDFGHLLAEDCLVVVDDYTSSVNAKGLVTKRHIDRAVSCGELNEFGVFPFGTWFGRLRRQVSHYPLGLVFSSRYGVGHAERVPFACGTEDWKFFELGAGLPLRRADAREVHDAGDGCYCITVGDGGRFVLFAPPGNPAELNNSLSFELRRTV